MRFKEALLNNGISDIDDQLCDAMDSVGAPIVITGFGVPGPTPALSVSQIANVIPKMFYDSVGLSTLLSAFSADVDQQICATLTAGATALSVIPPGLGVPGIPVLPIVLLTTPAAARPEFCKAMLQWAISLLHVNDPRVVSPFSA